MPKFYFHLRGDGQNFNDPDGLDYASLADAEPLQTVLLAKAA